VSEPETGGAIEPVGVFEPTGHAAVDAAVGALDEVASLAPKEQVAAYVEAHRALQETLDTVQER
jgi:hypothetical protein